MVQAKVDGVLVANAGRARAARPRVRHVGDPGLSVCKRYMAMIILIGAVGCAAPSGMVPATSPGLPAADPVTGHGPSERVATGLQFSEGPLWLAEEGILLFTEYKDETVYKMAPGQPPSPFATETGGTGAVALDPRDGTLLFATGGAHPRVSRHGRDGHLLAVLQDGGLGPNDLVVHESGCVFVTDPYGHTVYRIPPGRPMVAVATMTKPNGVALSPDHRTLYVADTIENLVMKAEVAADGTTGPLTLFARTAPAGSESEIVDGICIDDVGHVYVTTVPGINVFRPDGTKLGRIEIPGAEKTSNCSFGGADRRSLFVTAVHDVYRIPMPIAGLP